MRSLSKITAIIMLFAALPGCSNEENSRLNFYLVQAPGSANGAPRCTESASTTAALATGTYTLRLTFLRRATAGGEIPVQKLRKRYELVCDRIIKPKDALNFQVPVAAGTKMAMRVEAFQNAGPSGGLSLAYSGQMESVDLGGLAWNILLRQVDSRTCADAMGTPRAFHSATLLPGGQVLLLGGMVAESSGQGNKLHTDDTELAYATGKAELYDPDSMTFTTLDAAITPQRAFHQAVLLPSPAAGPYEVLLIGGLTPAALGGPVVRLKAGSSASTNYPFLFTPHDQARAAEAALVTITPSASGGKPTLTYKALPAMPKLMFPRTAVTPDGAHLVVAGGGATYAALGASKGFSKAKAAFLVPLKGKAGRAGQVPAMAGQINLKRTRVGHDVAPLGNNRFAVVGGTMDDTCGTPPAAGCVAAWEKAHAGELLTRAGGALTNNLITFGGTLPEVSGWHTLTAMGIKDGDTAAAPSRALLAGGFSLGRETSTLRAVDSQNPKSHPLLLLSEGTTTGSASVANTAPGSFKGGGYHAATALADGSVMLSGGNVNSNFGQPVAPCDKVASQFCAYNQLAVYGLASGQASLRSATTKAMSLGRYGHQATRLLDNSVLFTGGVTMSKEKRAGGVEVDVAVLTGFAEAYNPRQGGPAEDPFDRKAGQDYDAAKGQAAGTHTCGAQE